MHNLVRLSDKELNAIKKNFVKYFCANDHLWLFGSRVDLSKKGGDIDLYVETYSKSLEEAIDKKNNFLVDLQMEIGEQKIDVVIDAVAALPRSLKIYEEAKTTGLMLV